MLKDTITYGGQIVLTLYHENEELDLPNRRWRERQKIGRYWLEFEEHSVDTAVEFLAEDTQAERALLSYQHPLSPSGSHEICTVMKRLRCEKKPSHIFLPGNRGFRLPQEDWDLLCEFIKKYTGMDLGKVPLACGDTFLFHYVQLCYEKTKDGSILAKPQGFDRLDIQFKRGSVICESQTRHLDPAEKSTVTFIPQEDWDSFDLFAYEGDQLWFYAKDVTFIESIRFSMNFATVPTVSLERNRYQAKYNHLGKPDVVQIGQEKTNLRLRQEQQETKLLGWWLPKKTSSYLIQKGLDTTVYDIANKMLDHRWEEVMLFDPYLLDKKGKTALIDWMRLLCGSPAKNLWAVYYHKAEAENAMTLAEARRLLATDWSLFQILRRNANCLHLVGLSQYIHDRFLLCRAGSSFSGISLGTSLNSLDSNFFCVHILSDPFARECWETLWGQMGAHTVETEVIPHE